MAAPLIAVISEDPTIQSMVTLLLRHQQYQVISSQDAWSLLRQARPDLLVLDLEHSAQRVPALLDELYADPATRDLRCLVTSAHIPQLRAQAEHLRARGWEVLEKPFGMDALLESVGRMVGPPAAD